MAIITDGVVNDLKTLFDNLTKCPKNMTNAGELQQSGDSNDMPGTWEESINQIINKIDDFLPKAESDSEEFIKLLSMKASIMYEKAKIFLNNDMLEKSQDMLMNALNIIEHYSTNSRIVFLYLRIVNHLSYSLSRKGDCEKARELLEKVIEDEFSETPLVYSTEELFNNVESDQSQAEYKLNKLIINNMQMLGWVYGKLGLYDSHTAMQHKTLQKQLDTDDTEPLQWAVKCSRLASLFLTQCQWVYARYHLSAAQTILDQLEPEDAHKNSELVKIQADLSKCFMYYSLHLFGMSKKMIMETVYSTGYTNFTPYVDIPPPEEDPLSESYQFSGLEVSMLQIPASQITTTNQARTLFQQVHMWIKRVQLYYNLRDYPLEYVNAVLDLSELYKYLAFYEPDLDSQYNVQKKRSDALENLCAILKEIRPNCYVAVSVELLRELSEVQIELMGINLRRLYHAEQTTLPEDNLRKRIAAVHVIHRKLENVGNMLGNADFVTVYENPEARDFSYNLEQSTEAEDVNRLEDDDDDDDNDNDDNDNDNDKEESVVASEDKDDYIASSDVPIENNANESASENATIENVVD